MKGERVPLSRNEDTEELMVTTTTTADLFLQVGEDTVAGSVNAVAPLGALLKDAVPMCTLAGRGVESGPAHRRQHRMRTTLTD